MGQEGQYSFVGVREEWDLEPRESWSRRKLFSFYLPSLRIGVVLLRRTARG